MFPGHPYLRQQTHRAHEDGEREERQRVIRLIDQRMERVVHMARRGRKAIELARSEEPAPGDEVSAEQLEDHVERLDGIIDAFTELRRAVQQGWQR